MISSPAFWILWLISEHPVGISKELANMTLLRAAMSLGTLFLLACAMLVGFARPLLLLKLAATVLSIATMIWLLRLLCTASKVGLDAQPGSVPKVDPTDDHQFRLRQADLTDDQQFRLHQAKMKYAWEWFQYHADQRLKAFNFFLVILGILIVAYGAAMKESASNATIAVNATTSTSLITSTDSTTPGTSVAPTTSTTSTTSTNPSDVLAAAAARSSWSYSIFAGVVALSGVLISIAFLIIEIRNVELVTCGRIWLDTLESQLDISVRRDDDQRIHLRAAVGWLGWLPKGRMLRNSVFTHWFWMRIIYAMACLGFVLGTSYALWGF